MAATHGEDSKISKKAHSNSSPAKMALDSDKNGISKETDIENDTTSELTLTKNEKSSSDIVASKMPSSNEDSNCGTHDHNKEHVQTTTETKSVSQQILSPIPASYNEILDQNTALDADSSALSSDQTLETSNHTALSGAIKNSSTSDYDNTQSEFAVDHQKAASEHEHTQEDLDRLNGELRNDNISSYETFTKQTLTLQNTDHDNRPTNEPSDLFNKSIEAIPEILAPEAHKTHNADLDPSLFSEQNNKTVEASQQSTKTFREREFDDEIEPPPKRLKINDDSKSSDIITSTQNGETAHLEHNLSIKCEENIESNAKITPYQVKELVKILRNISRTNAGKNFRQPVAALWPSIAENYAAKISNPMDLSTIEKKLKEDAYCTINDVKADVHLIYNNSVTFNSADNPVSKCAMETRNALFSKFSTIPIEPIPASKKDKKIVKRGSTGSDLAIRPPPPKRSTRESQIPVPSNTQAFALDPTTNTPLIRRDSTKVDGGRPKREIHPPKNKDLPYAARPKNKKHLLELKFCEETITELQKQRYNSLSHPFMVPVDPVALGIPNYFAVIKKPMDISTVAKKLKDGVYVNANEFEKDIRQIFVNCYKYNPEGNPVRQMGKSFEEIFNNFWAKKEQYLLDNSPSAASPSDRESEDESEEDETLDGSIVTASLMSQKERLLEEQSKLITLMAAKHKDEGLLQMQTDLVELIQKRVKAAEEQAKKALHNKRKPSKSVKKTISTKKTAPMKKNVVKKKYLGTLEKETISAGLGLIPAQVMATVVEMIKTERPELADAGDETMELDIDSISENILWQIHSMIMKHVPELEGQIKESMSCEPRQPARTAKPAPKRKNKPMSKHEQERKIAALTNLDSEFARATIGSQEPTTQGLSNYTNSPQIDVNTALEPESSGDEDSDSEEE